MSCFLAIFRTLKVSSTSHFKFEDTDKRVPGLKEASMHTRQRLYVCYGFYFHLVFFSMKKVNDASHIHHILAAAVRQCEACLVSHFPIYNLTPPPKTKGCFPLIIHNLWNFSICRVKIKKLSLNLAKKRATLIVKFGGVNELKKISWNELFLSPVPLMDWKLEEKPQMLRWQIRNVCLWGNLKVHSHCTHKINQSEPPK